MHRRQFNATLLGAAASSMVAVPLRARARVPEARAIAPPDAATLAELPRMMDVAGVPGIAVAVVTPQGVWQHLAGVADISTGRKVDATSLWPAASLGKPVMALAALKLIDNGVLDLDRPLKMYVPGHAPDDARGDRITARHVLSHSSGLRNWRSRPDQRLVPDFEPGTRFQYSGEGYFYLQRAIERITGTGFEQFMESHLFTPLGMSASTYAWRDGYGERIVTGHDRGAVQPNFTKDFAAALLKYATDLKKPLESFTYDDVAAAMKTIPGPQALPMYMIPNAAATLITTTADYAQFLSELLIGGHAGVDLRPATRKAMVSPAIAINSGLSWGLGWGLEGADYLWHWGDNGPWKNFALVHPSSRTAIVIFTNGARGLNIADRVVTAASGVRHDAFLWL